MLKQIHARWLARFKQRKYIREENCTLRRVGAYT